jgi:hypothetical protein
MGVMAFRRRWVVLLLAVMALTATSCVRSGEIAIRNAGDDPVLIPREYFPCKSAEFFPSDVSWVVLAPGEEVTRTVASGAFVGDPCIGVATLDRTVQFSFIVEAGRTYEVNGGAFRDVGAHDEPWYFDMQRYEWKWSSWWVWLYAAPVLLGAPVGLFITVRFFYRFYVLKQE